MLITLSDLQKLQYSDFNSYSPLASVLQDRLQLVMRQLHLNLPVQPLLESDPTLYHLVREVQTTLPNALRPNKQFRLGYSIAAPLNNQIYVNVEVNVGFRHGKPKLIEWALRQPDLNWSDRIKLWVTTKHFEVHPNDVSLIVVALHPDQPTQKLVHYWNGELYEQTEQWLISLLLENDKLAISETSPVTHHSNEIVNLLNNLNAIEEVPI